ARPPMRRPHASGRESVRSTRRAALLALCIAFAFAASACGGGGVAQPNPTAKGHVVLKYGPWTVPGANDAGTGAFSMFAPMFGAAVEKGMIWNQPLIDVKKPCDNCY